MADLSIIFSLHYNSEETVDYSNFRTRARTTKTNRSAFHILEMVGNSIVIDLIRNWATELCGHRCALSCLKIIEDHAMEHNAQASITRHYDLENLIVRKSTSTKEMAMTLKAFIGAVYLERRIWQGTSALDDVKTWLVGIWRIRYKGLRHLAVRGWHEWSDYKAPVHEGITVTGGVIEYPTSSIFKKFKIHLNSKQAEFMVHYATASLGDDPTTSMTAYHTNSKSAERLARRLLQDQLQNSNCLSRNKDATDVPSPLLSCSKVIASLDPLASIRQKCFEYIQSNLSDFLSLLQNLRSILLSPASTQTSDAANALLHWNLVPSLLRCI